MQTIKASDLTKLEELGSILAVNGEHATNPSPVEAGNPPFSVPTSEAEIAIENKTIA
jgi:hypothetical protein